MSAFMSICQGVLIMLNKHQTDTADEILASVKQCCKVGNLRPVISITLITTA